MSLTSAWYQNWLARTAPKSELAMPASHEREAKLHEKIESYCKQRNWYYVHSRMDRPATNAPGTPDFIIATGAGTLWIEAKRRGEKPTVEQRAAHHHLLLLGHSAHFVWSFQEFEAIAQNHIDRDLRILNT